MFRPGPPRDRLELPDRFRFGAVEVDRLAVRVARAGAPVPLEPKAFDLLLLLAANPGRVIEKDEIFERIWPDAVVGDNALARVVAHLRRELGDSAEGAAYIETVRTRGYRFLPTPVAVEPEAAPPRSAVAAPPRSSAGRLVLTALGVAALAAALYWSPRGRERQREETGWNPMPVQRSLARGFHGDASFSPDGSQIVYASDAAGGLELFVRGLDGGDAVQITRSGGPKCDAAWSPDGRLVAYHDLGLGGLWVVSPTGGAPRQVLDFGGQPAWFPDGKRLVFSHPGSPTIGPLGWPATYNATLWTLDLASGQARELTRPDLEAGGHGTPAVSPDGRWVYFATGRHVGGGALWRVSTEGGDAERLTEPERAAVFWYEPTPAPDGRSLFAIETTRFGDRTVRLPLAAGGEPETILPTASDSVGELAISADGRRLLYSTARGGTSLEEVAIDPASGAVTEQRTIASPAARRVLRPTYAPDGARLLYLRHRVGVATEVVVLDRDSGEERIVAARSESESPRPIASWMGPADILVGSFVKTVEVDIETGQSRPWPLPAGLKTLVERGRPRVFAVSTDRQSVAFTAPGRNGGQELFIGRVADGSATERTRFGRPVDYPQFSRDGRFVAFQVAAGDGSTNELWRIGATDGDPERIASAPGSSWAANFAPDGSTIVYAALRGGRWHLAVAGVERAETLLDVPPETTGYLRWPDWSPDGRHIAYERMHYEASLWTVDLPAER